MTMNLGDLSIRKLRVGLTVALTAMLLICMHTSSAEALGSGKFPWRGDDAARTLYYYYGSGGSRSPFVYASTTAPGSACLKYVKRVKTRITLPNGSYATDSSLLGQCSSSVEISSGGYTVFQIKSTHTLQKWSGTEYNYVL
jgi:hypothetical protein